MRICLELTSSGSQLALHRCTPVDGLLGGHETELSSPGRGAVAIAPRRAARPDADDAAGLRRVARASRKRGRPALGAPTSSTRPRRAENSS